MLIPTGDPLSHGFAPRFWPLSINRNLWALAALPLIFLAPQVVITMLRIRHVFYVFYPSHLLVLWTITRI